MNSIATYYLYMGPQAIFTIYSYRPIHSKRQGHVLAKIALTLFFHIVSPLRTSRGIECSELARLANFLKVDFHVEKFHASQLPPL